MSQKAKTIKNAKTTKSIRNVLVQPFKTVWPSVGSEEAIKINNMINKLTSPHVVHGTNPVSHLLSQGQASALFITSDFHPQILGKQIIQMARRNCPQIQILAPECLKWSDTPEKLIAIRSAYRDQPEIVELLQYVAHIIKSKEYDKEQINSSSSKKITQAEQNNVERAPPVELPRLHLNRLAENKRTFIPQVSIFATKQLAASPKNDWSEYITLKRGRSETETADKTKPKKKSKTTPTKSDEKVSSSYIPLTVNRVQGNPNRKVDKKKKI
ncbi:AAEL009177-PA [Aedes aegypti]|uniref:AAEL009177-PA n=3 Tax=Aedes aegypti TaxID=7159 RepID=A0A1S4FLK2_AEDAE|nr:uncharacterized protein LOC5571590 [Aedes aegypti]EAT38987.1 AAEL009177-PA [Aedes aegypti]